MTTKSNCPLTADPQKRADANKQIAAIKNAFPSGIAQPALRALAAAGITSLDDLTRVRAADCQALHGMGPKAFGILQAALHAQGKSFLA